MKVAILQCDEVLDKFQPQFGHYHDMIRNMFKIAGEAFEFDCFDCQQQHYPEDIHAYDFYITTGSKAGAYEDLPWIHRLIEFVRQLDAEQKKLIGICFGHQIIALAKNKAVRQSPKGWGIGVAVNRIVTSPEWIKQKATEINIIVSHQDQISSLPEEAVVIAESDFCPYFIVQWNGHFLSVQGHPEWHTDYSAALINDRRSIIPVDRVNSALLSLRIKPDNALFVSWILDFIALQ